MNRRINRRKPNPSKKIQQKKIKWEKRSIETSKNSQSLKEKVTERILVPGENKTLLNRLISIINGAEEVLCIASFLIQEQSVKDAIVEAAADRGVRVYILTYAEKEALKDARREGEDPGSVQAHIEFVKSLYGKALVRTGKNFHAKYLLADPNDANKHKGLLFTGNLTGSLTKSADIALILNREQIHGLYHQFLFGFWNMATGELTRDGYKDLPQLDDSPVQIPAYNTTSSLDFNAAEYHSGIQKRLISFIRETEGPILAFAWSFDYSNDVVQELMKALDSGRPVEVIFNNIRKLQRESDIPPKFHNPIAMERLLEKKAQIFGYPLFHAKGLISSQNDRTRAIVMTANYDAHSIEHGFNSLIEVDDNQAVKIKEVVDYWKNEAEYILTWNDNS